jgi:hypothetical protein
MENRIDTELPVAPIHDVVDPIELEVPKTKRKYKVVAADGSVSYGFTKSGQPRKKAGRKAKVKTS